MNPLFKGLILSSVVLLAGCEDSNNAIPNNFFNEKATMQGTVFDGLTGTKITDASLKVTLVQGSSYRAATVRTGSQSFAGDYSIGSIPISLHNQSQYRIAITADNYQEFESSIAFDALLGATTNNTLDKIYNYVANVHLFPLGTKANDITILVTYNGEVVEGAMVELTRNNLNTIGLVAAGNANNLFSNINSGFLGDLSATTDTTGVATFSSDNLVLGGAYGVNVLPVTHEGIALAQGSGITVTVGAFAATDVTGDNFTQIVALDDLVPGTDDGLYIVSASNSDSTNVTGSGILTITFSRAVSFADETDILATLSSATTAVLDATNVSDSTVTASLSADGLTMTFTPVFTTAPVAFNGSNSATADNALLITYSNAFVRLQSTNDTGNIYDIFGTLVNTEGVNESGAVKVTASF